MLSSHIRHVYGKPFEGRQSNKRHMCTPSGDIVEVFLCRGLVNIPCKIFWQNNLIPHLYDKKVTYSYGIPEFINNWRCPVPVASGKKEDVTLVNQILLYWLINPDPGKASLVKGMIFIKVPNLDHPVSAVVIKFDLFSKLVSNLNICDFSNLLFHM